MKNYKDYDEADALEIEMADSYASYTKSYGGSEITRNHRHEEDAEYEAEKAVEDEWIEEASVLYYVDSDYYYAEFPSSKSNQVRDITSRRCADIRFIRDGGTLYVGCHDRSEIAAVIAAYLGETNGAIYPACEDELEEMVSQDGEEYRSDLEYLLSEVDGMINEGYSCVIEKKVK